MTAAARAPVAALVAVLVAGLVALAPAPVHAAEPTATSLLLQGVAGPAVTEHGQPLVTTAQVTVATGVPDGWVYVVVDGVSRRVDVAPDGTASSTVMGLRAGAHAVSATFVPRDPAVQDGSTSATLPVTVARATTGPLVRVSGTRPNRTTRVRTRVATSYGTTPTGKVTLLLFRKGVDRLRTRRVALEEGAVRWELGRLDAGRYRVVVRYGGDGNHVPSREKQLFRVRRR